MKSRVDLTIRPEAIEEIRAARDWYRAQDVDSAREFLRDLAHSVSILEMVEILAVAHGSRRPGYWHDRDR